MKYKPDLTRPSEYPEGDIRIGYERTFRLTGKFFGDLYLYLIGRIVEPEWFSRSEGICITHTLFERMNNQNFKNNFFRSFVEESIDSFTGYDPDSGRKRSRFPFNKSQGEFHEESAGAGVYTHNKKRLNYIFEQAHRPEVQMYLFHRYCQDVNNLPRGKNALLYPPVPSYCDYLVPNLVFSPLGTPSGPKGLEEIFLTRKSSVGDFLVLCTRTESYFQGHYIQNHTLLVDEHLSNSKFMKRVQRKTYKTYSKKRHIFPLLDHKVLLNLRKTHQIPKVR